MSDGEAKNAAPYTRLHFSHLGFYVRDLERMEEFYTEVLGFTVTDRGIARGAKIVFTSWDPAEHHQVVLVAGRPEDCRFPIINQISFRVASLEELKAFWLRVKDDPRIHDLNGTNHGNAWSIYFRDPEENRIEIFCDSDWYIDQPCIEALDLSLSLDEIRARSEVVCRASPGFASVADHRAAMATKIKAHTGVDVAPF